MPQLTQFLIFELGRGCNLGRVHAACPNMSPDRFAELDSSKTLDDETIVETAVRMHRDFGFSGMIGWHYYNEPLLQADRMWRLMERISAHVPEARYVLWTNGTLLPEDCSRFAEFSQIHITDYSADGHPPKNIDKLDRAAAGKWQRHTWPLDGRLDIAGPQNPRPCVRMFTEMIFDHHGNCHLCCYDWRGRGTIGNLLSDKLEHIVARWREVRDKIAGRAMKVGAPDVCLRCTAKHPGISRFVPEVWKRASDYVKTLNDEFPGKIPNQKVAVVFVSYLKVPEQRLIDHFAWNDAVYRRSNATVHIVTDREHDGLPPYVVQVLFPLDKLPIVDGKPRFSLTATKNAGIGSALDGGADLIVCTDVDMAFPDDCWDWMLSAGARQAAVPVYVMAQSYETRETDSHDMARLDHGCGGTIAMRAQHWQEVRWNEDLCGYGGDDGAIRKDIKLAGIREYRKRIVYHIAHDAGADQKNIPGQGRSDCWGRGDGFNADNFAANREKY